MFQACRPAGRLFYLAMAVAVATLGLRLASREDASAWAAAPQSGPVLTSVVDTVYLAGGSRAQGVLIITWPAFVAANGAAVAAGVTNVTLGANGALNVALASNSGANPPGAYYTVVFQLGPGEVRTEYWMVPTSSPATLAEVRMTPGAGTAAPGASVQYVASALATKANDNAVVHLGGAEMVTGAKSFAVPPNVPTPVSTGNVVNKGYVDSAIATVGAGNYLPTAGGAMTGPLTLSASPVAPLQAAAKQYVDASVAVKADLVSGLVPTGELGSGTASGTNCLLGSGVWGPCGSSANATAIQSVPVASSAPGNGQVLTYSSTSGQYSPATPSGGVGSVSVSPSASQNIVQPVGTQTSVNNLSNIRYVTASMNWSATPGGTLTGGTQATVTLAPCPVGVDTSNKLMYLMYVQGGGGTSEPVLTQGGSCTSGAVSGTVIFTSAYSHAAGYTLGSASSGIQETINDACSVPGAGNAANPNAHVVLPATGPTSASIPVYGTIFAHCSRALIEGHGTQLACSTRDRCLFMGDQVNSNHYGGLTIKGINFSSTVNADGCLITNTARASNVVTITTASACTTIQTGDRVNINFTDNPTYWGMFGPVIVSGTSITFAKTGADIASVASPGTIAIENAAIEDNAMPGTIDDIKSSFGTGRFNQFIVEDDDEAATIRGLDADGTQGLTCTANHCGSYVYSANGIAPVIWIDKANISPQCKGNGVTVYNNNSVRVSDSVMQGFGMWGVNTSTILGNYGATAMDNIYMEEGAGPCPHPYMGANFSATGIIFSSNNQPLVVRGGEQPAGHLPTFPFSGTTGSTQLNYYVVAHDVTQNSYSYPLFAGFAATNGGAGNVSVQWPHIPPQNPGDTVVYDLLRMQPSVSLAANSPGFPVRGACTGGGITSCGSVATSIPQCSGLVCTYTDAVAATASYPVQLITWTPLLPFWPANVVFSGLSSQPIIIQPAAFDQDPGDVVSVVGNSAPSIQARWCNDPADVGKVFGGAWIQCLEGKSNIGNIGGLLLQEAPYNQGSGNGVKGRLNLEGPSSILLPHHLITLVDSNYAKTLATIGFRPPNDANDTYIGQDANGVQAGSAQLAFGAPIAISNYIGNAGDNTSYLERLTAAAKTFNVPVTVNGNLTVTGTCTGCGGGGAGTVNGGTATQVAMYAANGATVSGDSGLTDSGTTLNYAGASGITAAAGTFGGNVTVNGQLLVAGPWTVSSPIPGAAMVAAGAGTSALGVSNDGNFYISANAGTPQKVATTGTSSYFSNLFQEDANDLGEYSGTTPQGLNVYGTRLDASDYERLALAYDTVNPNYFKLDAQATGSGVKRGIAFWVNGAARWGIDQVDMFKPFVDNAYDEGSSTFRVRSGYFGTGVITPSITLAGDALSNVIGTPTVNLMTAGTVSGTGQPLCTDGTGNLTITTVGCPPGTGTIGGSGATQQFAYWTNTNGLGAAPFYVNGANTVEQYNGANVQTFNVYGTYTSATSYERLSMTYVPGDTYYELQTQQGSGGGSQRGICFGVNNSCKWAVDTNTAFKPFNDNARDIGTGTARVRDFYLGRNLIMSGTATTYNGKTTAGTGLAPVYGTVATTGLTAAVGSTTLCASATCGAGQYVVNYYLDSTLACTTPGSASASLTIGWTDETSAKTLQVPLSGAGVSGGNAIALGNTANFGNGTLTLWSAGSANVTYSTSYTGCTTGTGTYAVRIAVRQLQ